ncbi:hypothetical protein Abm4_1346 [Methanobrevibacter sp. AbM4]|jgi:hypothetical protein|nr:hypothetical protein Abm4_1346 [Methanobrevibacter sp. AbM4]
MCSLLIEKTLKRKNLAEKLKDITCSLSKPLKNYRI